MSVAFTKEDSAETASETLLPDRPVSSHPNLVTEAGLTALEFQLHQAREAYERDYILKKVEEARNNVSRAAELLGLERSHLYRKMKALGIQLTE